MKIAHLTGHLSRNAAGVGVVVNALAATQLAQGHDVRVFAVEDVAWRQGDRELWSGAPATVVPGQGPIAFGYGPALLDALFEFGPDIVHLHGIWMYNGVAALRWHQETGKPYILSIHGMMSETALSYSPLKKRIARLLFQDRVFAAANHIHVTSEAEADEVRDFGLVNALCNIHLGIDLPDLSQLPATQEDGPKSVLTVGRLHPKKGVDRLLDAWAIVENGFPEWELRIVGPDEVGTKGKLLSQIKYLGLTRVFIDGPVYGRDKAVLMRDADVFVLPTRSENFAFTVAESLSVETPVISTNGAPWAGLETNGCGWWIEQGVQPLSEALRTAMSLPDDVRHIMGQRGRRWMQDDFSWSVVAAALVDCYGTMQ